MIFAASAFAALGSLNIVILIVSLIFAAIIGDTINYKDNTGKVVEIDILNKSYKIKLEDSSEEITVKVE